MAMHGGLDTKRILSEKGRRQKTIKRSSTPISSYLFYRSSVGTRVVRQFSMLQDFQLVRHFPGHLLKHGPRFCGVPLLKLIKIINHRTVILARDHYFHRWYF
jgi:hypothetical protein